MKKERDYFIAKGIDPTTITKEQLQEGVIIIDHEKLKDDLRSLFNDLLQGGVEPDFIRQTFEEVAKEKNKA